MVKGERELDELCGVVLRKLADGGSEGVRICNGSWDWVLQAEEDEENAIFFICRQIIVRKGKFVIFISDALFRD